MTKQQQIILVGGAAAGLLLWKAKSKTAITAKKTGATSTKLPVRGTNSPAAATTYMATRGGTTTAPRVPSSGLGYPATGSIAQGPTTTAGAIALGGAGVLNSILSYLRGRPATAPTTAPKPSTGGGPSGGGPSGGGPSGGGPSGGRQPGSMGGAPGVAAGTDDGSGSTPVTGGHFDDQGNWVADESPINTGETSITGGAFDDQGNWVPDASAIGETPVETGAWDENGNWNPDATPALEETPPLDASPIGTGDFGPIGTIDPIMLDQPTTDGISGDNYPDDSSDYGIGGGDGGEPDFTGDGLGDYNGE